MIQNVSHSLCALRQCYGYYNFIMIIINVWIIHGVWNWIMVIYNSLVLVSYKDPFHSNSPIPFDARSNSLWNTFPEQFCFCFHSHSHFRFHFVHEPNCLPKIFMGLINIEMAIKRSGILLLIAWLHDETRELVSLHPSGLIMILLKINYWNRLIFAS